MTPSLPRSSAGRLGASGLVLASTVFGTVLVPATAHAATDPALSASLQTTTLNDAVTEATFTVENHSEASQPVSITFDVPAGSVHNRADTRSSLSVDGGRATLALHLPLSAGERVDMPLWLLNGAGARFEHCSIEGVPVTGCSAPDDGEGARTGTGTGTDEPGTGPEQTGADSGNEQPGAGSGSQQPGDADHDAAAHVQYPTVTHGHTDVPVAPLGAAADVQSQDGTQLARSDLRQAGRWIRRGQTFVVEVPDGVEHAQVGIGQYGGYSGINDCHDVGIRRFDLHPGTNTVTAPHDGLVSVIDTSTTDEGTLTVRGGYPVPTFIAGETDRAAFDRQLQDWSQSPFLQLIGERVQADVLRSETRYPTFDQNEEIIAGLDLDAKIGRWDDVIRVNERFWGAGRAAHRVHFATPSRFTTGTSGYAESHDGWIGFSTDHAKPHHLLDGDSTMPGERHVRQAIGRVFQQDVTRWKDASGRIDALTSVDLASLVIEERVNGRNWLDSWTDQVLQFREKPVEQREYSDLNPTVRSLVFDQLRRAYGDDFIAKVAARNQGPVLPGSQRDARRDFILAAANVAGRDLTPFFEQWGITVEPDLRPHLAEYPALETPIWDDFDALH